MKERSSFASCLSLNEVKGWLCDMKDKLLGMVGLSRRAGKASVGADRCAKSIKNGSAKLVLLAADASENTKKDIKNSCAHYNIRCIEYSDKITLGRSVGLSECGALSVNDDNFAKAILDRFNISLRDERKG